MTDVRKLAARYQQNPDCPPAGQARRIADSFHRLFYGTERMASVTWRGVECWKYPTDLAIYAEILHRNRPDIMIECGTFHGGASIFMADVCEGVTVHTIDLRPADQYADHVTVRPPHPQVTYWTGSSTDPDLHAEIVAEIPDGATVMVVLDSDHTRQHVTRELDLWAPLVSSGQYLVVEDTNLGGRPVVPGWGPGPHEAVQAFLQANRDFHPDRHCERLLLTANPGGWLLRR